MQQISTARHADVVLDVSDKDCERNSGGQHCGTSTLNSGQKFDLRAGCSFKRVAT